MTITDDSAIRFLVLHVLAARPSAGDVGGDLVQPGLLQDVRRFSGAE